MYVIFKSFYILKKKLNLTKLHTININNKNIKKFQYRRYKIKQVLYKLFGKCKYRRKGKLIIFKVNIKKIYLLQSFKKNLIFTSSFILIQLNLNSSFYPKSHLHIFY